MAKLRIRFTFIFKFNFTKWITCQSVYVVLKILILVKFKWVWWNWILVSKAIWFLCPIDRVRDIRIGQRLTRENFLTLINQFAYIESNILIGRVIEFRVWIMSPILYSIGSFWKGEYGSRFWKVWWNCESIRFWDCCSDSHKASILFSKIDLFTIGFYGKEVCEAWFWENRESNMLWECRLDSRKSFILIFRIDDFLFWIGETGKDEYKSWNCGWHDESNKFLVCLFDSRKSCILFSKIEGFLFWIGETVNDGYKFWNGESNRFWDCRSDLRKSSILVSKTDDWSFWRGETEYDS